MRSMEAFVRIARPMGLPFIGLLMLAVASLLIAMPAFAEGNGDGDAGDDLASAIEIGRGTWTGTIFRNSTMEDPADYYRFPFPGGAVVEARAVLDGTSTTHLDVNFRVFDQDLHQVISLDFPQLGSEETFAALTNDLVEEPDYYFAITWEGSSLVDFQINYTLFVNHSDFTQDDALSGGDAPATYEEAFLLVEGDHTGSVGGSDVGWEFDHNADGGDMFVLSPEEGLFVKVTITLDWKSTFRDRSLILALENSTGGVLDLVGINEEGASEVIRFFPKTQDAVYLNVTSTSVINNYTLRIVFEVPGADGDGNADAGEDPDHAMDLDRPLMPGTIMRGHGAEDLADYFDLTFESSAFVEVTLTLRSGTTSPSNLVFRVLDHTKVEVVNFTMSDLDAPKRFASLTHSRFPTLRYYFGITWEGPEDVTFEFRYELTNVVGETQDDAGTGEDVSNTTSGAESVSFDDPVTGTIGGTNPQWSHDLNVDGADIYELFPTSGKFLKVKAGLDGFEGERRVGFDIYLVDQAADLLVKPHSLFIVGDEEEFTHYISYSLPVYVVVTSESESCDYTIVVSLEDPPDIDIFVASMSVTPSRPEPETEATITIVVGSSVVIGTETQIRVELFDGGNKLAEQDVIFDDTDQVVVTFPWTVPSSSTDLTALVDTLNVIAWDKDKDNNEMTIHVEVGPEEPDNGSDDEGRDMMFWIMVLVGVIALVILVAVLYVVFGGHDAEDEEPEEY